MKLEVFAQNSLTEQIFDISTLCSDIAYETFLDGQPGKLSFIIQKDPNDILQLINGSIIKLVVDDVGMFLGYIVKMGTDAKESYKITAYDQLWYLKNEDYYVTQNQTASQIAEMIFKENELKYEILEHTTFICPLKRHDKVTLYTPIEYGIQQTLINTKGKDKKYCFIKDDFGTIKFSELQREKTNIIIGNKSLLTDYQYEISIEKETFNEVRVVKDNEKTKKRDTYIAMDSDTQKKWGKLRLVEEAPKEATEAQMKQLAFNLLELKNREAQTMKLNALGMKELKAGSGFTLQIDKLNIKEFMWITSITHNLSKDLHTMTMDIFI